MDLSKNYAEKCKEIINKLDWFENNHFKNGEFDNLLNKKFDNLENIRLSVVEIETTKWEDEGKYQYSCTTYQLVLYDSILYNYPCDKNIVEEFNLYFNLPITRSGSYFSDYDYNYDRPIVLQKKTIHVPEKIIPAHDEVKMEEI